MPYQKWLQRVKSNNPEGSVFSLHAAYLGSFPGIRYGSPKPARNSFLGLTREHC